MSSLRLWQEQTGHPRIIIVDEPLASSLSMSPRYHNKTVEEYRQLAEKCREIARTVSAENERVELLARARTWDLIAERADHTAR